MNYPGGPMIHHHSEVIVFYYINVQMSIFFLFIFNLWTHCCKRYILTLIYVGEVYEFIQKPIIKQPTSTKTKKIYKNLAIVVTLILIALSLFIGIIISSKIGPNISTNIKSISHALIPSRQGHLTDISAIFTLEQKNILENRLTTILKEKNVDISFVSIPGYSELSEQEKVKRIRLYWKIKSPNYVILVYDSINDDTNILSSPYISNLFLATYDQLHPGPLGPIYPQMSLDDITNELKSSINKFNIARSLEKALNRIGILFYPELYYKIAFASQRNGNWDIYIMNVDGSDQIGLTDDPSTDITPAFSPDGNKIAFSSSRDGKFNIYIMNQDGTEQKRLTDGPKVEWYPAFSPDGEKIAFSSYRYRGDNFSIYIMNQYGTGQQRLIDDPSSAETPYFSPDGNKIVFSLYRDGSFNIFIINADGTGQIRLTDDQAIKLAPHFSPDGSKIVFTSKQEGSSNICTMNLDGTDQKVLTNSTAVDFDPTFYPDGGKIAFSSRRDGNSNIYIMNADGTDQIRLTDNLGDDSHPSFCPIPVP